jgi:hypothetical protein
MATPLSPLPEEEANGTHVADSREAGCGQSDREQYSTIDSQREAQQRHGMCGSKMSVNYSSNYGSNKNLGNIVDANIVTNNKFYLSPVAHIQEQVPKNTIDLQKNIEMSSFLEKQLVKQKQLKERYKSTGPKPQSTLDDNVMISKQQMKYIKAKRGSK